MYTWASPAIYLNSVMAFKWAFACRVSPAQIAGLALLAVTAFAAPQLALFIVGPTTTLILIASRSGEPPPRKRPVAATGEGEAAE
jgi:hypothetical protein